jgi:hypothetical protein
MIWELALLPLLSSTQAELHCTTAAKVSEHCSTPTWHLLLFAIHQAVLLSAAAVVLLLCVQLCCAPTWHMI